VATSAPEVRAIVSSSAASGQYNSVSYRSDVRDGLGLLTGDAYGLDIRSPVIQIVQTLMDVDEPSNFPTSGDWLDFAGIHDGCLPFEASRNLAGAQHLAIVNPQWPSIFGDAALDPITLTSPVAANGPGGTTRVLIETAGAHRAAFGNPELAGAFIDQVMAGQTPVVPVGPYDDGPADSCAPRYGEVGNNS